MNFHICVTVLMFLNTVTSILAYNGCIFGNGCYFQCNCGDNIRCDSLDGSCPNNQRCSVEDSLMINYYPQNYSVGAGCQVGNLAYEKKSLLTWQHHTEANIKHVTTGNIEYNYQTIEFEESDDVFVVLLENYSNIKFIDLLLHENMDVNEFKRKFAIYLDKDLYDELTPAQRVCQVQENPFPLLRELPHGTQRVHYQCGQNAAGSMVKLALNTGVQVPLNLQIARIVAVGHRYIDLDTLSCEHPAGDEGFRWCSVCRGYLPPDCRTKCETGRWGDNCEETCGADCASGQCHYETGQCLCGRHVCTDPPTTTEEVSRSTEGAPGSTIEPIVLSTADAMKEYTVGGETGSVSIDDTAATFSNIQTSTVLPVLVKNESTQEDAGLSNLTKWIIGLTVPGGIIILGIIISVVSLKCKRSPSYASTLPLLNGQDHIVRYRREQAREGQDINSTYAEIPADHDCSNPPTSMPHSGPGIDPDARYIDPSGMGFNNLSSDYLRAVDVKSQQRDTEDYEVPIDQSQGKADPAIGGYEPLRQANTENPYTCMH